MKLNQAIAVIQSVKANSTKAKTQIYHTAQKTELFEGISRTYEPNEEDGFVYPSEGKPLQAKAEDLLSQFESACQDLFDFCATQDWANTSAKADIVVGDTTVLRDVPVAYLLFLEKQLQDIRTFINSLPVQDIGEEWTLDEQRDCWATPPKYTTKTKRVVKPVVLYEATQQHPAQVKESSEDVPEGKWKTIRFTGALTRSRVNELLRRVDALTRAVIFAREQANSIEVEKQSVSQAIFGYLFAP